MVGNASMGKVAISIKKSIQVIRRLLQSESSTEIQRRLSLSSILANIAIFRANQLSNTQETAKPFLDNCSLH